MKLTASIIGLIVGIALIVTGMLAMTGSIDALNFRGIEVDSTSFGGDFYTYSYRATRAAGINVSRLGEMMQGAVGIALSVAGLLTALLSMYGIGCAAASKKMKTQLLDAIRTNEEATRRNEALLNAMLSVMVTAANPQPAAEEEQVL